SISKTAQRSGLDYLTHFTIAPRLDPPAPCRSRHCFTDINDRELDRTGAIRVAAAGLDLRAGPHRGRQVCAANIPVTGWCFCPVPRVTCAADERARVLGGGGLGPFRSQT